MTTAGVPTNIGERIYPKKIPSYSYKYPSFKQVQLAAVKDRLYHPSLPTFRRMDMDTACHRLPDQHCRQTTTCGSDDFKRAKTTLFQEPKHRLACMDLTETGRKLHRELSTPESLKCSRINWTEFLNKCPERYSIKLPEIPDNKDMHFTGYAVRYLKPDVTASWRKTLMSEPMLDQYGQRPVPANVFGRYRDTYPQYSRAIANENWR